VDEAEVAVGRWRSRGLVRRAPPGGGGCPFSMDLNAASMDPILSRNF
jgi:hypothetical protein